MVEQICVLLALTKGLFDPVPLEKVKDAQDALQKAAKEIPADVTKRFESAEKLSDADKTAVLDIATRTLAPFVPKPVTK
jgi:F-type H+-transporting ATPase subunit alpha